MCKALWVRRVPDWRPILQTNIELNPRSQSAHLCGIPTESQSSCCSSSCLYIPASPKPSQHLHHSVSYTNWINLWTLSLFIPVTTKDPWLQGHSSFSKLILTWLHKLPFLTSSPTFCSWNLVIHCAPETLSQSPTLPLNFNILKVPIKFLTRVKPGSLPALLSSGCLSPTLHVHMDLNRVTLLFLIIPRTLSLPSLQNSQHQVILSDTLHSCANHPPCSQDSSYCSLAKRV